MVGAKARIDLQQFLEAPDEQASADEHDDRQRDLGHHQRAAEVAQLDAGRTPAAFLQCLIEINAGNFERRQRAEQNAGQQARAEGERERRPVNTYRLETRDLPRHDSQQARPQYRYAQGGQRKSRDSAEQRQQQAFDQKLPNQTATPGAYCGANRQFTLSSRRLRQQQVGDVRAGDQQDERDGREDQQNYGAQIAGEVMAHRRQLNAGVLVGRRIQLPMPLGDGLHLPARLLDRHAGLKSPNGLHGMMPSAGEIDLTQVPQRQPEIGLQRILLAHHADNSEARAVELNAFADDARVICKAATP